MQFREHCILTRTPTKLSFTLTALETPISVTQFWGVIYISLPREKSFQNIPSICQVHHNTQKSDVQAATPRRRVSGLQVLVSTKITSYASWLVEH